MEVSGSTCLKGDKLFGVPKKESKLKLSLPLTCVLKSTYKSTIFLYMSQFKNKPGGRPLTMFLGPYHL